MSQAVYLLSLIAALLSGVLAGTRLRSIPQKLVDRVTGFTLYLLILNMGFRIGRTEEVSRSFGTVGVTALLYALATVTGTVAVLRLVYALSARKLRGAQTEHHPRRSSQYLLAEVLKGLKAGYIRQPLRLLALLFVGFFLGLLLPLFPDYRGEQVTTGILFLLLFLIGISLSRSRLNLKAILRQADLWLLPVGTIAGSYLGALVLSLLLAQRLGEALALASGFGWYSLSGVLLSELNGPYLGAVAFLTNMFREALALVLIPLLAQTRFPYIGIGVAGATSMDVTLPIIEISCGPESVPFSLSSGVILSVLVPILLPLVYPLG